MSAAREQIHFVTGRLAEHSLREVLAKLAPEVEFDYTVEVLKISVAALMTTDWVARHVRPAEGTTHIVLPGYCRGDVNVVQAATGVPVELGPRDVRDLPTHFGLGKKSLADYGAYAIEILAEINFAPALSLAEILRQAATLREQGADLIDLGCDPGDTWTGVGEAVRALRDQGHRVSIDSYNVREIAPAVAAGAELVLSVNHTNREHAADWGCEVVLVPDDPRSLDGLHDSVEYLSSRGVPLRIDPILEPIGFGFAESLRRYLEVRRRFPDVEMMMGIGNLTELTDVDSAGVNVLLLGFCEELGIRSVLTTQVINWARSSVTECDLGRRLVHYAVRQRSLPKHVEPRLVTLRDTKVREHGEENLAAMARQIRDPNFRLFAEGGLLHALALGHKWSDPDPFELFERIQQECERPLDSSHAFYLGYELAKATTALTLNKQYQQDQPLDWGHLTRPEVSHHDRVRARRAAAQRTEATEPTLTDPTIEGPPSERPEQSS